MVGAVGGDHAVGVERVVGGVVIIEVAAVEERHAAVGLVAGERLIDEVPDEAALIAGVFAHEVPIAGEAAHRVAHRVGVFALDERTRRVRRAVALAPVVVDVHRAHDVGAFRLGDVVVGIPAQVALVLHRARRVGTLDPVVAGLEVGTRTGLVAQRPDDDRGVVAVALDHAAVALQVRLGEGRNARQRELLVAHAVRLDVGLVDDIDAVAVAELVPLRVVGIVRRAHGVDVELLHDADILQHPLAAHDVPRQRVDLVAVDALDEHGLSVDEQLSAADLRRAEADRAGHGLGGLAAVADRDFERIEVGRLGRPLGGVLHGEHVRRTAPLRPQLRRGDLAAGGIPEREREAPHGGRTLQLDAQRSIGVCLVQRRGDVHVAQVGPVARRERHAPRDARVAPEVLILEVGAVRPAENLQRDEVPARPDELRDVEVGRELAVLAVADEAAVDPDVDVRRRRADREEQPLAGPVGGHLERAAVGADVVLGLGHVGRVVGIVAAPCVAHVDVDRVAVAVEFPHARHGHAAPRLVVVVDAADALGTLPGVAHPVEAPHAVEREAFAGLHRRRHRQPVDLVDGRILPFAARLGRRDGRREAKGRAQGKGSFHRSGMFVKYSYPSCFADACMTTPLRRVSAPSRPRGSSRTARSRTPAGSGAHPARGRARRAAADVRAGTRRSRGGCSRPSA